MRPIANGEAQRHQYDELPVGVDADLTLVFEKAREFRDLCRYRGFSFIGAIMPNDLLHQTEEDKVAMVVSSGQIELLSFGLLQAGLYVENALKEFQDQSKT